MSLANLKRAILSTSFITALSFSPPVDADSNDSVCPKHQCCDHHQKIAGTYFVCGFDPYLDVKYEGTLVVKHLCCNVYSFHWTFVDGSMNTGTGIFDNETDIIAVSFTNSDSSITGVELIKIRERKITGRWVHTDQCKEGKETLVKIRC